MNEDERYLKTTFGGFVGFLETQKRDDIYDDLTNIPAGYNVIKEYEEFTGNDIEEADKKDLIFMALDIKDELLEYYYNSRIYYGQSCEEFYVKGE